MGRAVQDSLISSCLAEQFLFCSLRWARSEAFDSLGQLLALLCMPFGGKARSQGNMCAALGAAVRTWLILLALKSIVWRRLGQGLGYLAALVVDVFVSGAE